MSELAQRRPQSVAQAATVDYDRALQFLGLSKSDPRAHALILVCSRYELDPLLGHVSLYDGKPYVHFAGYLHIANAHPEFAGIECLKEWDDETYFWATVRVHRADRDFPAERTGKSRKQKRKKDGSTYTDDDADAKAFAQACRRALRMSFNIDHPDPAEDDAGPVAAPAPVVEVTRRIDQMHESSRQPSDPGPTPAPPATGPGSGLTSEAEARPAGGQSRGRDQRAATPAPDDQSPEPNPSPTAAAGSGEPTSPTSPGDGKAGRGRRAGRVAPGRDTSDLPPAGPTDEAEQAAFDEKLADGDAGKWAR